MDTERCSLRVLEAMTRARASDRMSLDRLFISENLVAVLDGATPKGAVAKEEVEWLIADVMRGLKQAESSNLSLSDFVEYVNVLRKDTPSPSRPPTERPALTMAAVSALRREVWRVGDAWISVDDVALPLDKTVEQRVATIRADITAKHLQGGASVESLRERDPGREAVLEAIIELDNFSNADSPDGFGVIDGGPVPARHQEVWLLSSVTSRIVLATDGYLSPAATLERAETELADRLQRDPLMIEHPPATKGVAIGASSFDDRTYLKLELTHVDGCGCGGEPPRHSEGVR